MSSAENHRKRSHRSQRSRDISGNRIYQKRFGMTNSSMEQEKRFRRFWREFFRNRKNRSGENPEEEKGE